MVIFDCDLFACFLLIVVSNNYKTPPCGALFRCNLRPENAKEKVCDIKNVILKVAHDMYTFADFSCIQRRYETSEKADQ